MIFISNLWVILLIRVVNLVIRILSTTNGDLCKLDGRVIRSSPWCLQHILQFSPSIQAYTDTTSHETTISDYCKVYLLETRLGLFVLFPRSIPAIWISFDISFSSSSLELQSDVTELYCVSTCNLAKWHSFSRIRSMVEVVLLWFAKDNGPDLLAGVTWRTGDKLFLKLCNFQETSSPYQHPCEPLPCKHLSLPP